MQGMRQNLLAGSGFADDEHGHISRRHHPRAAEQGFKIGRLAYQFFEHSHGNNPSMNHGVLDQGV